MAKLVEYTVARPHQGDKITDEGSVVHKFKVGEPRLADPTIVKSLVLAGVLVAPDGEKAEPEDGADKNEGGSTETKVDKPALTTAPAPQRPAKATTGTAPAAKADAKPAANKSEGNSSETKVEQPAANKAE